MQSSQSVSEVQAPVKEIRALLLDDSNFDRQRIRRMGGRIADLPLTLDEVATLSEMEDALDRAKYDVILVDYRLAEGDGVQALNKISAKSLQNGAGRIMITGNEDIGTAVQAMRSGCHDFLCKNDMSEDLLREAMLNAIALARRNIERQQQVTAQRELMRECLIAALSDAEVQDNIGTIVHRQMARQSLQYPALAPELRSEAVDAFIAGMGEADEFIFSTSA